MSIIVGTPTDLGIESKLVCDFFKNQWKRPVALSNLTFYQWQFLKVPHQDNTDHCCIVVEDNKILGAMGVNHRHFLIENKRVSGAELTTWIVDDACRNKGIGTKMISFLQNKYELIFGLGISTDALSIYLRHGFRYAKSIPRFIKILDWDTIESFAQYEPLAKQMFQHWQKQSLEAPYIQENITESRVNALFDLFKESHNLFSRKYEYIKWRYLDHPSFDYQLNIIKSLKNPGNGILVVIRKDISDEGLPILHILDLIGDEKDLPSAIQYITDFAIEHKIPIIDFFCTNSKISRFFLSSGWFSINDDHYFKFPHLFHPTELREPASTSMIYWSKEYFLEFSDLGKLYITKQDADFDRPTLINLRLKDEK